MAEVTSSTDGAPANDGALTTALSTLRESTAKLETLTGGAGAVEVLAEFARTAALELAQYFDQLPNAAFDGVVPHASGWRRWLPGGRRTIRHRVLAVRYTLAEPALSIGNAMVAYDVVGELLALGEDGMLRVGPFVESISVEPTAKLPDIALPFFDERVRNVPTSRVTMKAWFGANTPAQVASPEVVLELLRVSAVRVQEQQQAQSALLQRLLGA